MAVLDENGRKLPYNSYERKVLPRLDLVEAFARHGLSDTKMAERFGISAASFSNWKEEHPEFEAALDRGRDEVDLIVENALLRRALGFTSMEVTKERLVTGVDTAGKSVYHLVPTKKVYKQIPPDVTAIQYWLENRLGSRWTRSPVAEVAEEDVNRGIQSVAELINNPVTPRKID